MFELDPQNSHVETSPERVIDIYTSINRSSVAPPDRVPEHAQGYIATVFKDGSYEVLVYLHLTSSNEGLLYRWDEGAAPADQVNVLFQSALEFTESMGFMMDDMHYRDMSPEDKAQIFEQVPMFHADLSRFKQQEEEEEPSEDAEELVIEPVDQEPETGVETEAEEINLDVLGQDDDVSGAGEIPSIQEASPEPEQAEAGQVDMGEGTDTVQEGDQEEDSVLDSLEMEASAPSPEEKAPPSAETPLEEEEDSLDVEEITIDDGDDEQTMEGEPVAEAVVEPSPEAEPASEEAALTPEEAAVLGSFEGEADQEAGRKEEVEEVLMEPGPGEPVKQVEEPAEEIETEPEPASVEEPSQQKSETAQASRDTQSAAGAEHSADNDREILIKILAMM